MSDQIAPGSDPVLEPDGEEVSAGWDANETDSTSDQPQVTESDLSEEGHLDEQRQEELAAELDELINRINEASPEYSPPRFSPQRLVDWFRQNLASLTPEASLKLLEQLRNTISQDLFDVDTWKGIWYVVNYSMQAQTDIVRRRMRGDYETDDWGYDQEVFDAVKPFFDFMYKYYWRVQTTGIENIPEAGRALLASNHSGQLPFDAVMVGLAVSNEHPAQRLVRTLYASWFPTVPFIAPLFVKTGQTLATEENGIRLLEQEQLVAVFPEGIKGVSKLFKDRYKLARFGRGGFVQMALRTGSPIIPVSVVGAEETYISLAKSDFIARLIGFPFFPISITWPWFGLLGFVPIPTKWFIDFGEPILTEGYESGSYANMRLVSELTNEVRNIVQNMIFERLAQRQSVIFG